MDILERKETRFAWILVCVLWHDEALSVRSHFEQDETLVQTSCSDMCFLDKVKTMIYLSCSCCETSSSLPWLRSTTCQMCIAKFVVMYCKAVARGICKSCILRGTWVGCADTDDSVTLNLKVYLFVFNSFVQLQANDTQGEQRCICECCSMAL